MIEIEKKYEIRKTISADQIEEGKAYALVDTGSIYIGSIFDELLESGEQVCAVSVCGKFYVVTCDPGEFVEVNLKIVAKILA